MKTWAVAGGRLAAGALLTLALVAGSRVDLGAASDASILRLDLRLDRTSVEVCRDRTEAELEALPVHMRRETVCDEVPIVWRLEVELDDRTLFRDVLEPGGLRRDRPATLDRELRVPPGHSVLRARLEPEVPATEATASAEPEAVVDSLPRPRLRQTVRFVPGRLVVLALDAESDTFLLVR